jgi:hypothetical protein
VTQTIPSCRDWGCPDPSFARVSIEPVDESLRSTKVEVCNRHFVELRFDVKLDPYTRKPLGLGLGFN